MSAITDFWLGRDADAGPEATRFHSKHDPYDLAAIARYAGRGSRVLDLGCGTCRIANALVVRLGCPVHAVDFVPGFLEHAVPDPRLTTEVGDVRTYERPERYDLVLSLGVITYLETPEERAGMYARCARMLAPGGVLLLKAQFGRRETVVVDGWSEALRSHYKGVYPLLEEEVARLEEHFAVEVHEPYPAHFNRYDNTAFRHLVARPREVGA